MLEMKQLCCVFLIVPAILSATADNDLLPKPGECGLANIDFLRNGKTEAEVNEFPWIARIGYNDGDDLTYKCQAVLISQRYLVSVAHCLHGLPNLEPVTVVLGDWDTKNDPSETDCDEMKHCSTPVQLAIEEIVIHPMNNKRARQNDIAMIRLNQSVTYTDSIRPICLPSNEVKNKIFSGESLAITGWFNRIVPQKQKLQKMITAVHNNVDCQRQYPVNITNAHMCAIACDNENSYMSSSPLMDLVRGHEETPHHFYLVALLSYGTTMCGIFPVSDVFTRVDYYLDWLKENVY